MSDATQVQAEGLWRAYQCGQVSLDHTAKEVFVEVVSPILADNERLQKQLVALRAAEVANQTLYRETKRMAEIEADNERLRDAIERAGRCLVMSNNGNAEAIAILRATKTLPDQPCAHAETIVRYGIEQCRDCGRPSTNSPEVSSGLVQADQPSESVTCNCDDQKAKYCVNRISRTEPCKCKCHGVNAIAAL